MADVAIVNRATVSAPKSYTLSANEELVLKAVRALVDGSGAASAFLPVLQLVAPDGTVMWEGFPASTIAAGASADVSWFPRVGLTAEAAAVQSGVTVEQFLWDQLGTDGATDPIYSTTVLTPGATYVITLQGTYSEWNAVLAVGSPEANAMFPGSTVGRVSTEVGVDAECCFASESSTPDPFGIDVGKHVNIIQMDLGSGFTHVEPIGGPYSTPQPNHFYRYNVVGQGSVIGFDNIATPRSDNYGKLQVTIQSTATGSQIPGGGTDYSYLGTIAGVAQWLSIDGGSA